MIKRIILLVIVIPFCACAGDGGERPTATVRDSAGVHIVESRTPLWTASDRWRLAAEATVDVGGGDADEEQLFQVTGAVRLRDGRIVVANTGTRELWYYAASGGFLTKAGGRGGGPGEFESLSWIDLTGDDSVVVYDVEQRRLSVFDPSGRLVHSFSPRTTDDVPDPRALGILDDGSVLVRQSAPFTPTSESGVYRSTFSVYRFRADGFLGAEVGEFLGDENFVRLDGDRAMTMVALFGRSTTTLVHGNDFYVASNDSYEIRRFGADGGLISIIRRQFEPLPVTRQDELERKRIGLQGIPEGYRNAFREITDEAPVPTTMPSYRRVLIDVSGNLWVEEFNAPSDDIPRWSVFDTDGVWLGTLPFPSGFAPYDIGADYVLGVWQDSLDVEHVRLYDLIKPES